MKVKPVQMVRTGWGRCVIVAILCLLVATVACDDRSESRVVSAPPVETQQPIKQAKWEIKTHPSAAVRQFTKREKHRVRAEKPKLKQLVRDVYDVLFLPSLVRQQVIRERFTPRAAAALLASGTGISDRLSDVKTTLRRAHIGIGAATVRQAAAQIWLHARATAGDKKVRIVHRSTLWLEKTGGRWKAIAFEVKQRPAA
jgi:hypothetical protein